MVDRREFVRYGAVAAAIFGIPLGRAERAFGQDAPPFPGDTL
jgi:hypothetical protein